MAWHFTHHIHTDQDIWNNLMDNSWHHTSLTIWIHLRGVPWGYVGFSYHWLGLARYALSDFLNAWPRGSKSPLLGQRRRLFCFASIRLMYPWLLYDNLHWTVPSRRLRHGKDQQNYHQHRDGLSIPSSASHGFRSFRSYSDNDFARGHL